MGDMQGAEQQPIEHAEDHGVGADREGQCEDCNESEAGRLAQDAQAEAEILKENLDKIGAERLVGFLYVPGLAAKLDARSSFRLGAVEAGAAQIVGTELDVGAKLFLHLGAELRTMEELSGNGTKPGEEFHRVPERSWAAADIGTPKMYRSMRRLP